MTDCMSVIGPTSEAEQKAGAKIANKVLAIAQAEGLLPTTTKIVVLCVHPLNIMHGQLSCGSEFVICETPIGFLLKVETDDDSDDNQQDKPTHH